MELITALFYLGLSSIAQAAPVTGPDQSVTPTPFTFEDMSPPVNHARRAPTEATSIESDHLSKRQSTWNPPANLVKPLKQVWDHEMATYGNPLGFKNYGYDQIMANKGYLNYCVRWESTTSVTADLRASVEKTIQLNYKKWIDGLVGFDKFPYSQVPIKVVGWAVRDKSILQGSTSGLDIYTTKDQDGIPQCDPKCGRFFHQDANYGQCPGGAARHYDQSLWITDSFDYGAGAGGDWGQRMSTRDFMEHLNKETDTLMHEIGHTLALDDFYDWKPDGVDSFIMLAYSAFTVTEFDTWMMRDWWRNLKSRYGL